MSQILYKMKAQCSGPKDTGMEETENRQISG